MKKPIAVAVILLFIGVAIAPCIHANISKEMIEYTTEVCGLNGGKQTVKLTHEEAKEVEALFKSIRNRLNATESREEAEEIFKEAVVELDKFGLLGGLRVKQAQRLVTGGYQNTRVMRLLEKIYNRHQITVDVNENRFCLIAGFTSNTCILTIGHFLVAFAFMLVVDFCYRNFHFTFLHAFCEKFGLNPETVINQLWGLITFFSPIELGGIMTFGYSYFGIIPAKGWVFTIGLNGIKMWRGSFYGKLSIPDYLQFICYFGWPGAKHFTGIRVGSFVNIGLTFYLGYASHVALD